MAVLEHCVDCQTGEQAQHSHYLVPTSETYKGIQVQCVRFSDSSKNLQIFFMSSLSVLNVGSTDTDIHICRLYVALGLLAYCRKWLFLQTRIKLCDPVGKEHYIWEAGCPFGTLLCVTVCYFHFRYKARHLSLWTVKHYSTPNDGRDLKFKSSTELIWLICCAFVLWNSWVKLFFCWKGRYK